MDSIERMRRLNELTKELKQRGFAESSFEAIQQANQIYGDDDITSEVKHGIIKNSAQDKNESGESNMDDGAIVNLDKKITKLNENVNSLTDKMNEIIKAINDMDNRLNVLKNKPAERIVERVVERPVHEEPTNQDVQKDHNSHTESNEPSEVEHTHNEPKKDEYSTNQRTGSFQSQDVAIDKMFYYGKK